MKILLVNNTLENKAGTEKAFLNNLELLKNEKI